MNGAHQVRGGERSRPTGLERIVGMVDRRGKPVVPREPEKIGELGHGFAGEGRSSAVHPFEGQKHPSGRAGITAWRGEEDGIAQRGFILLAAHQPDGCGGTLQGLAGAPAAHPHRLDGNEIIQIFQGNAGGKRCAEIVRLAAARRRPAGQRGGAREERCGLVSGRIHGREHIAQAHFWLAK